MSKSRDNFFEVLGNISTDNKDFKDYLDKLPKLIDLAEAVVCETGCDIEENDIEHQCGNVWVGDVTILGINQEQ